MTDKKQSTDTKTAGMKPRPLPGDKSKADRLDAMIRVDHAGEFGAVRIYQGQLAVLGTKHPKAGLVRHMAAQEKEHLAAFDKLIAERGVRPTLLSPFWHAAGFALGAGTALLGEKAAMACTQAVEEVIDEHYQQQRDTLATDFAGEEPEFEALIEKFQAEEAEHRQTAVEQGAEDIPGHALLSGFIKTGCRAAIWLAKRV